MNKTALTEVAVLQVAIDLITANGSTTTHDVKKELRNQNFEAFQHQVSQIMADLFGQGKLASTNDPSRPYQIYDLPKNAAANTPDPTVSWKDKVVDLLQNGSAAVQEILSALVTSPQVTRKDLLKLKNTLTGDQYDTGFKNLLKKGIIVRVATGTYAVPKDVPAIGSTPQSTIGVKAPPVDEKEEKLQELANFLSDGIKRLEEIHQNIVTGLAEYNNMKIKQN